MSVDARFPFAPPLARLLGLVWVCVSLPVIVLSGALVSSADGYTFVLIFMASGAYTTPGLVAGWMALRRLLPGDRAAFACFYGGLVMVYGVGVGMLVGLVMDWRWGNPLAVPTVIFSGVLHSLGLVLAVRSRSGGRSLSVDVIDGITAVVALSAPAVVLWGPTVVDAEASWFTVPAAAILPFTVWGVYWATMLLVRLGPGRSAFKVCALGLALTGLTNTVLQITQAVSEFTLPAPPLIALHALCMSMYLLIPLNVPRLMGPGLDRLPLQDQVRGARLPTAIGLGGLAVLMVVTGVTAGERPWAVPFALGVVAVLCGLGGLRQMATVGETRRLYRQVEEASEMRRDLLDQLVERSVHDQRDFAGKLYEQTVAAYSSFRALAGAEGRAYGSSTALKEASALVEGNLARQAESVRELLSALRPIDGARRRTQRLATHMTAYLTSIYEGRPTPRLGIAISDDLRLDWVSETMLLQIVREALHNVRRHSDAGAVELTIEPDGDVVVLQVTDDGTGFAPGSVVEGAGTATMRASAAVIGAELVTESTPGQGTTVRVRMPAGAGRPVSSVSPFPPESPRPSRLWLVPDPPAEAIDPVDPMADRAR